MDYNYNHDTFSHSYYGGAKRFAKVTRNPLFEGKDLKATIADDDKFVSEAVGVAAADNLYVQGDGENGFTVEGRLSDASSWFEVTLAKQGDVSEKETTISDNAVWVGDVHSLYEIRIAGDEGTAVVVKLEDLGIQ